MPFTEFFPLIPIAVSFYLLAERGFRIYRGDWHRTFSILVSCVCGGCFLFIASKSTGLSLVLFCIAGLSMGLIFPPLVNRARTKKEDKFLCEDQT